MTTNGWCFWLSGPNGRDVLYVGEPEENAALAIAATELGDRNIEARNEIPGSVRDFLKLEDGAVVRGHVQS